MTPATLASAANHRLKLGDATLAIAEQVAAAVNELSASASSLSDFTTAAVAVADKTRLLALNAMIESVRAGDAGQGFTIVASELRAFSDQTTRVAKEIVRQVGSVRGDASVDAYGPPQMAEILHAEVVPFLS